MGSRDGKVSLDFLRKIARWLLTSRQNAGILQGDYRCWQFAGTHDRLAKFFFSGVRWLDSSGVFCSEPNPARYEPFFSNC
jgi:hypothetical protein